MTQDIDINTLTEEISAELQFKYPEMMDRLTFTSSLNSPLVHADKFSLETIVKNLLDNALFYRMENTTVRADITNDDAGNVVLEIKNTTMTKLTQENIANLFKPLYQVDSSRTHTNRHGLGLSIVKNIAQLNGYDLSVDYSNDQVITFSVVITKI